MKIAIKKIFDFDSELNHIKGPIKISFISNSIHWNNLFVIENNIFVKYKYLIEIFEYIEYNKYTTMNDVYIDKNEIFDMSLLKNICCSIYSILQNLNHDAWNKFITDKYKCTMVSIEDIKFNLDYKIIQEPNVDFMQGKVPIYWLGPNNIYTSFNSICSKDNSFSPYYEQQIIKLEHKDGIYIEKNQMNIDKNKYISFIDKLIPTPFENKAIQITNAIIHN